MTKKHSGLLLILAAVAIVRIAHFLTAQEDPYVQHRVGDEAYYHDWGLAVSGGNLLSEGAFYTSPLFAYVLGLLYRIAGDSIDFAIAFNSVLGIATVVLIYLIAQGLEGRSSALASAVLAGFCLPPIYYASFAEKTSLVLFLTALSIFLILRSLATKSILLGVGAGVATGLAALAHPLILVLLPASGVHVGFQKAADRRGMYVPLLALSATAVVILAPATVHNYLQDEDFVLVCSNGGQNFYVGNHAANLTGLYTSPGFSYASIESEEQNFKIEAERRTGAAMKPSEVSSFWYRQGISDVLSNPSLGLKRFVRRLRWTLGNEEITDTRNIGFYSERLPILGVPFWGFGFLSVLALGAVVFQCFNRRHVLLLSFSALYAIALGMYFVYGRYRLPLMVPFSVLGGGAIIWAYHQVTNRSFDRSRVVRLPLILLALWWSYGKVLPGTGESYFTDYYNLGNAYLKSGDIDAAIGEYEKAIWVRPGNHPALEKVILGVSDLYTKHGDLAGAERLLTRAVGTYPDNPAYSKKLVALLHERAK